LTSIPCTISNRPNSTIPRNRSKKSGIINANSRIAAPRRVERLVDADETTMVYL
jgi:hypothetical protein